ncbi:hypothetical protein BDV19DRAFT_386915 [Aspergillus venezuelensis]
MAHRPFGRDSPQKLITWKPLFLNLIKRPLPDDKNDDNEETPETRKSARILEHRAKHCEFSLCQIHAQPKPTAREVAGVSTDDLPIPPLDTNNAAINHYLDLPIMRVLDWRVDCNGVPKRKHLHNTRSLSAAFVQTRGEVAETPCISCARGKGLWQTCVTWV